MFNPATVLISDPDPLTLTSLARQARSVGLGVLTDISCEVVALATRYRPDTIILELNQRVDGRDIVSQLKKNPFTRATRIIVFSSVMDPYIRQTCLDLGASDYIFKPARSETVIARVAALAGIHTMPRAACG